MPSPAAAGGGPGRGPADSPRPGPCRVCGSLGGHREFLAREMQFGTREEFAYFECADCGCLQIAEVPADLARHYPSGYYSSRPLDERKYAGLRGALRVLPLEASLFPDTLFRRAIARAFPRRHFAALAGLGVGRSARVLDVGCGNGKSFLYPLRKMGFERVAGCDPFLPGDIRYGNGLTIEAKRISEIEGPSSWDVIAFHHAFEHMPDPLETLETANRLLRDGGLCLIRIPTVSSFAWEHYGVHWVQLDAPRHLFLHSVESMRLLAAGAGFRLARTEYDSHSIQFWASEGYARDVPLKDHPKGRGLARIAWMLRKLRLARAAARLNRERRGDQAAFVLVKAARREGGGA
jgi:SAM-dependent methyltransferase